MQGAKQEKFRKPHIHNIYNLCKQTKKKKRSGHLKKNISYKQLVPIHVPRAIPSSIFLPALFFFFFLTTRISIDI